MKIGLFGGTFNPIHSCHLTIADQVRQGLGLDRVIFIPAGTPPLKEEQSLAPAADRLEMVRLATARYSWAEEVTTEVDRPGRSYSVETLIQLRRQFPDDRLFFLLGADAFADIMDWREPEQLLALCELVVIARPSHPFVSLRSVPFLANVEASRLEGLDRKVATQEAIDLPGGRRLCLLALPPCPASSTAIRAALAAGTLLDDLLPEDVRSYILRRRLYQ